MGFKEGMMIVEICKVEPNGGNTPKNLPLTFFDLLWLRSPPLKRLYFFNTTSSSDVIPRLKQSLSLTLDHFLPLAGNVVWPESSTAPFVQYLEGDGVSFSVVEACRHDDLDFEILSGADVAFEAEAYHALVPDLDVSGEKAAVVAVQVTVFPGDGFSIGFTLHHAVLDARSVQIFIKSWAHICRSLDPEGFSSSLPAELTPFFDRTGVHDPRRLREIYVKNWMSFDGPENRSLTPKEHNDPPKDLVRRTFTLTHRDIENLRLIMPSQASNNRTSTFALVSSFAWILMLKAEGIDSTGDSKAMLAILADSRTRFEPPLASNYFGNCITGNVAMTKAINLAGAGLGEGLASGVNSIGEAVRKFEGEEMLRGAENWVLLWDSMSRIADVDRFISIAGSPRFEAYGVDFGWGRPVKTDVVSIDSARAFLLQDAKDGDGVQLGLALRKPEMEAFVSGFRKALQSLA